MTSVLEKIDLDGERKVTRQNWLAALTMKFSGAETQECLEVVNKMRLIVIAARHRNICPVGRGTISRKAKDALKTLHTTELLRCDADLIREYLDKMPLAEPETRGQGSSPRFARLAMAGSKDIQSGPNRSMFV
jgi:hypothetical protein